MLDAVCHRSTVRLLSVSLLHPHPPPTPTLHTLQVVLLDEELRRGLVLAFTEDDRLHVEEVARLLRLLQGEVDLPRVVAGSVTQLPTLARQLAVSWSDRVLAA